jgi:3-isopropylmalate dehydrogenase
MKREYTISVLPGDGIGPEVIQAALRVLEAAKDISGDFSLIFKEYPAGAGEYQKSGDPLPEDSLEACAHADAVLLGAMGLPSVRWPDGRELTPQIDLREKLDLYGGLRPIRLYHENDTPLKAHADGAIDLMLVRENTEGLFATRHSSNQQPEVVTDTMRITRKGAERVFRLAFEEATRRQRRVTLVDKANVLPSMVYFRQIFQDVAAEYPRVKTECIYVDAMCLYLVREPQRFDVIVTENMFGDILSDLMAGLVGGMGMAPSGDLGESCAVFQPSHGTAPDIAGMGVANPVAAILSAAMMLDWLEGEATSKASRFIWNAVERVLSDPRNRTPDMGGTCTTSSLTAKIIECLNNS